MGNEASGESISSGRFQIRTKIKESTERDAKLIEAKTTGSPTKKKSSPVPTPNFSDDESDNGSENSSMEEEDFIFLGQKIAVHDFSLPALPKVHCTPSSVEDPVLPSQSAGEESASEGLPRVESKESHFSNLESQSSLMPLPTVEEQPAFEPASETASQEMAALRVDPFLFSTGPGGSRLELASEEQVSIEDYEKSSAQKETDDTLKIVVEPESISVPKEMSVGMKIVANTPHDSGPLLFDPEQMRAQTRSYKSLGSNDSLHSPKPTGAMAKRMRSMFVQTQFTKKCKIGNPNIDTENVVFIPREAFIKMGRMTKYEDCASAHVKVEELSDDSVVLFVSHRWQLAGKNLPDDIQNSQYSVVLNFLYSEAGSDITHLWLDYSCVVQNLKEEKDYEKFQCQLDNIQTAVFLSDVVLVVPRIESADDSTLFYTDLRELLDRGWCLFEGISALLGQCQIFVTFLAGKIMDIQFHRVGGGFLVGDALTQQKLQKYLDDLSSVRSYYPIVKSAIANIPNKDIEAAARDNWRRARDPAQMISKLPSYLEDHLDLKGTYGGPTRLASLTLSISSGAGKKIAAMLPEFTSNADRSVVTNLLANVSGFCLTGFEDVKRKPIHEINSICLSGQQNMEWDLDLSQKNIFPYDLRSMLKSVHICNNFRLNLAGNPLGYNAVKVMVKSTAVSNIAKLRLAHCAVGDFGASALGSFLQDSACKLDALSLQENDVTDAGASKLAEGLKKNSTLLMLDIRSNHIGIAGAKALAEGIKVNSTLSSLAMRSNCISDAGALAFADALEINNSLDTLSIWNNKIGDAAEHKLKKAWKGEPWDLVV